MMLKLERPLLFAWLLLSHLGHLVSSALLEHAAILLLVLAGVCGLHALGLNELRLAELLVLSLVLGKLLVLPLFGYFDLGLIKRFANEHLEDRACLLFKVEDGLRVELILLVNAVELWHEDRVRRHIDVEVWLNFELVHLARNVGQLLPVVAHHVAAVGRAHMLIRLLVVLLLHLSAAELLTVSHDLLGLLGAGHGAGC